MKYPLIAVTTILALLAAGVRTAAAADFNVRGVHTQFSAHSLGLSARLRLKLTRRAEQALDKGIPLDVVIDVDLLRHRRVLWDDTVSSWSLHRILRFHALSRQYLVSGAGVAGGGYDNFSSLSDALGNLGHIHDLRLPFTAHEPLVADGNYRVRLRVYLDIGALPSPLQPLAYALPAWHLNSGWTTWSVEP